MIAEAFADDDVLEDFRKEKEAIIEASKAKEWILLWDKFELYNLFFYKYVNFIECFRYLVFKKNSTIFPDAFPQTA